MDLVRYLWSTQLLASPGLVAVVLVLLVLCCLPLVLNGRPSSRPWGWVLSVLTLFFLVVLVQPVGGWAAVGQHERHVNPIPFAAPAAESRESLESADGIGVHAFDTSDGRSVYSDTSGNWSLEEIEESRALMVAEEALYDAYRVQSSEGEVVWHGAGGEDLAAADVAFLEAEVRGGEGRSTQQSLDAEQNLLNFLVFVPLGMVAALALPSWPVRVLYGPLLSLLVESLQWVLATGRESDVTDLITNGAGALVGAALVAAALGLHSRRSAGARPR